MTFTSFNQFQRKYFPKAYIEALLAKMTPAERACHEARKAIRREFHKAGLR